MASLPCHPRLLALDGDAAQTTGAERWETRSQKRTKAASEQGGELRALADAITHKTIHITYETLIDAVDQWIPSGEEDGVVYVALHACGSLTPSVLRAILLRIKGSRSGSHGWKVSGAVVVGCCYNLMEASGKCTILCTPLRIESRDPVTLRFPFILSDLLRVICR